MKKERKERTNETKSNKEKKNENYTFLFLHSIYPLTLRFQSVTGLSALGSSGYLNLHSHQILCTHRKVCFETLHAVDRDRLGFVFLPSAKQLICYFCSK